MLRKILMMFALLTAVAFQAFPVSVMEADSAYSAGRYGEAVEIYKSIIEKQGYSAEILFDLGNAAYKNGDNGLAMLSYERAHRLDPRNKEIKNNLQYLENRVSDGNRAELKGKRANVAPDDLSFFSSVHNAVAREMPSDLWAVYAAMAFILLVASLGIYFFTSNVVARKVGFFGSLIFLVFTVAFLCFSFMAAWQFDKRDEGVVKGFKVELLTEPSEQAKVSAPPLVRGTKLQVLDTEECAGGETEWYKVRLNSDYVGWVRSTDFELI